MTPPVRPHVRNEQVLLGTDPPLATVRLNRPEKLNTLTEQMWHELYEVAQAIDADESIRAVVLTGSGDRAFCAGLDLSQMGGAGSSLRSESPAAFTQSAIERIEELQRSFTAYEQLRAPVIAAVNGACIGGGLQLILACDIRYGTPESSFMMAEVKRGLLPDMGGTQRLPRIVGLGAAKEIILTGRKISAEEAARIGLLQGIFPKEKLLAQAREVALEIAENAPLGVQGAKRAIRAGLESGSTAGMREEAARQAACLQSNDLVEGIQAFLEKRKPRYKGA